MTADSRRRWDTDDRFVGVADASGFAHSIEELAGPFASHGHSVRLVLTPTATSAP